MYITSAHVMVNTNLEKEFNIKMSLLVSKGKDKPDLKWIWEAKKKNSEHLSLNAHY